MLLPEHGQRRLVVDVARVQVRLELGELLLAAGVEGDLGHNSILFRLCFQGVIRTKVSGVKIGGCAVTKKNMPVQIKL